MKVFLLVCLGLLLVASSGWGDAAVDKEDELSLKTLDSAALKDPSAGIPSLRNIREAEKKKDKKGKKKNAQRKKGKKNKKTKSKKNKGTRKQKKNKKPVKGKKGIRKNKKNKKSVKGKKGTRNKKKSRKGKKVKSKGKKTANRKKNKKRTSAKENKKVKKQKKKKKSGKNTVKSRKNKKAKKNIRQKIKHQARKNKRKNKKSKTKGGRKAKKGKNGSGRQKGRLTCGSTQVNDTCLQNAVDALNFEKNQIQNFYKQKARLQNHNKTTGNKQGKKGEFEDAAKYLLQAIGGNISAPTCGESGTAQKARSAKSASDTYKTLLNCSASIHDACTMPTRTFNATIKAELDKCAEIYNISKMTSDTCRTNKDFLTNGTMACECWSKAAIGIVLAKKNNCAAKDTATAVKKAKNKCISAFSACKKAEDSAVGLIHTCMAGEVKNISATGRLIF